MLWGPRGGGSLGRGGVGLPYFATVIGIICACARECTDPQGWPMTPESAASTQLVGLAVGNLVGTGVGGSLAPPPSSSPPSPVATSSGSGSPSQSGLLARENRF